MTLSLYSATVPSFQQILAALRRVIDKGETFADEAGLAHDGLIEARLIEDMLPFSYQVKSTAVHSLGAIDAVRQGRFTPDRSTPPDSLQPGVAATSAISIRPMRPAQPDIPMRSSAMIIDPNEKKAQRA